MSILDALLIGGAFAALYLIACFIKDDSAAPRVPDVENFPGGSEVEMAADDDELELSWSHGTGDWR